MDHVLTDSTTPNVRNELRLLLPRMHRFALTLTADADAAEDLSQATCERILSRASQWRPGSDFDRWAFTIMRSIWHNELRRQRIRREENFASRDPDNVIAPHPDIDERADLNRTVEMVMRLPEAQREVVLLCLVEGQTYSEAAAILDIPVGTVMSRLSRARAALARTLEDPADLNPHIATETTRT